MTVTFINI